MPRKRLTRKKRGAASIKSKPAVEQRTEERSFGSGLDEVGFRPFGRRILVSKQRSGGERAKAESEAETKPSIPHACSARLFDDPLSYDTSDPSWVRKAAEHALSGADDDAIEKQVDAALRRWKLRPKPPEG